MDKNDENKTVVFDGEYESLLEALRKKYNDKLKEIADKRNAEYRTQVIEILGEEFKSLVHERVLLLKNLKIFADKFAIASGISPTNEKVLSLASWISENDRDQARGEKLISELIDEARNTNPEFVNKIKHMSKALSENREQIDQLFKNQSERIKEQETEIKSEMKKLVLKLMLEYNLELKILRKQFDLPPIGLENPFDKQQPHGNADKKDLMEQLSKDDDKHTFFTIKDDKDDLN